MICKGQFIFKEVKKNDGGKFTNDKGDVIEYPATYVLKVDELSDKNGINERKFKFPITNDDLFAELKALNPYEKIEIVFDTFFNTNDNYNNNCRLMPVSVEIID